MTLFDEDERRKRKMERCKMGERKGEGVERLGGGRGKGRGRQFETVLEDVRSTRCY